MSVTKTFQRTRRDYEVTIRLKIMASGSIKFRKCTRTVHICGGIFALSVCHTHICVQFAKPSRSGVIKQYVCT